MAVIDNSIKRFRGDTYPLIVTLTENDVAVDLTTAEVKMTIGLTVPVSIVASLLDATAGVAQFEFDQTHVGTAGRFSYDIQVTDGAYITTYVKDIFELVEDVTA